jgi:hypothetical protein
MRRGVGTQPDLFQAPAPSIGLPELLCSKALELLRKLLIEAISPGAAIVPEEDREGGNDHDHS